MNIVFLFTMNQPAPDILMQTTVRVVMYGDRLPALAVDRVEQPVRSRVVLMRDEPEERKSGDDANGALVAVFEDLERGWW